MSESYKIPNPEGWEKPWPFADEVEFWRVPEASHQQAIEFELARESPPELLKLLPAETVFWPYLSKIKTPHGETSMNSLHQSVLKNRFPSIFYGLSSNELREKTFEGDYYHLQIGLKKDATKTEILDSFRKHLEQLEASEEVNFGKPKRGKKQSDATALLSSLALYRIQKQHSKLEPVQRTWQWIEGTPLQSWPDYLPGERESEKEKNERITEHCCDKIRHLEKVLSFR